MLFNYNLLSWFLCHQNFSFYVLLFPSLPCSLLVYYFLTFRRCEWKYLLQCGCDFREWNVFLKYFGVLHDFSEIFDVVFFRFCLELEKLEGKKVKEIKSKILLDHFYSFFTLLTLFLVLDFLNL